MTCLLHPTGSMKTCEKHVRRFQCIDVWLLCCVCSACAALAARASDDFGLVVAANTTIFVYSLDLIRILIVASSWRDVRRAWQQPPRGPWLKMGWQLSGVWWTIMDHVTSSWTVIFACHFHHNYNGTTSRDSNVEYLRRRVRAWKKPWHVPTPDGLSMLPRHLLIPPDLSPWHHMAPVVSRDANSKLIAAMMLSHYSGRFRFSACFNSYQCEVQCVSKQSHNLCRRRHFASESPRLEY